MWSRRMINWPKKISLFRFNWYKNKWSPSKLGGSHWRREDFLGEKRERERKTWKNWKEIEKKKSLALNDLRDRDRGKVGGVLITDLYKWNSPVQRYFPKTNNGMPFWARPGKYQRRLSICIKDVFVFVFLSGIDYDTRNHAQTYTHIHTYVTTQAKKSFNLKGKGFIEL